MDYKNALELFQTLLEEGDENLEQRLLNIITSDHGFFNEATKLISAYHANKKETLVNDLINSQAENLVDDSQIHELLNTQIAQYKLTKKLGQGGMGVVYLGERNDGQLQQRVAIKFIFPSIATLAGENFLQKEAQHLANLDHANIAHIYTVGTTDTNLPYMVMEYVEGVAIDEYCENKSLDLKSRLTLFQKLCDAVHFAHQNMVIHADIKPSNILVNELGELKLMDFGIARSINQVIDSAEESLELRKQYLQAVSQNYASPEQIDGAQLTSTCDIYSLGKVIQELLNKMVGAKRELALIQGKCCEHDAEQRYQSVLDIKIDIDNWLNCMPLTVEQLSHFGLFKKLIKRNPILSLFISLFILSLILFSSALYLEKKELEQTIAREEAVSNFMQSVFRYANKKRKNKVGDYTIEEILDDLGQRAKSELKEYPLGVYAVLFELAKSYQESRDYQRANQLFSELPKYYPIDSEPYLAINYYISRAYVYNALVEQNNAMDMILKAEELSSTINFPTKDERIAMMILSIAKSFFQFKGGEYSQTIETAKNTLKVYSSLLNVFQKATLNNTIGASYNKLKEHTLAQEYLSVAINLLYEKLGTLSHPSILTKRFNLMKVLISLKQHQLAIEGFSALKIDLIDAYGNSSVLVSRVERYLAQANREIGQCEQALTHITKAKELQQDVKYSNYLSKTLTEEEQINFCLNNMTFKYSNR